MERSIIHQDGERFILWEHTYPSGETFCVAEKPDTVDKITTVFGLTEEEWITTVFCRGEAGGLNG